jgi:hypothetical protein
MNGLHMHVLDDHVEAVITDDDIDGDWQLKDAGATLAPVRPQLATIDTQLAAALELALQRKGARRLPKHRRHRA